jgi:hypothetical protein
MVKYLIKNGTQRFKDYLNMFQNKTLIYCHLKAVKMVLNKTFPLALEAMAAFHSFSSLGRAVSSFYE